MLFHLIKKDFLIVKKYVLIVLVAAILIPPVMRWRTPEFAGTFGFILSVIFSVFMLLQYVSLKEYQFPKATTLLCATPFSRSMMVLSKYIFCIAIYVACCIIFGIETLLIPGLGTSGIALFILMFFVTSVFIGIYLPIQYKLGYEKTKFAFAVIIAFMSGVRDMYAQKVWKLGFDAEMKAHERIAARLERFPGFDARRKYRLLQIGRFSLRRNYYRRTAGEEISLDLLETSFTPEFMSRIVYNFYYPEDVFYDNAVPGELSKAGQDFVRNRAKPWPSADAVYIDGDIVVIVLTEEGLEKARSLLYF